MESLASLLDAIRANVRAGTRLIARGLNRLSSGKITPNSITLIGLVAHIFIAWLIATQSYNWAGVLLIIFGLFDTLDGELARLQNRASSAGMLLDASTDRMKEVILYIGVAYALVASGNPYWAVWAVAACGCSILVSYVKAKGETAMTGQHFSVTELNRLFQDGLMRYEVRMFILIVGLFTDRLIAATVIIALSSAWTAFQRLNLIIKKLP